MNTRAQRGGAVASLVLAWLFRVAVFAMFAPIAWRYLMRGAWFEFCLAMACAIYLGALLTPSASE
jgi:hypothetical protein